MDLTGLTMHQSPVDGYGGGVSAHKGSGSSGPIANNPIVKALEKAYNWVNNQFKKNPAAVAGVSYVMGKYGGPIMKILRTAGQAAINAMKNDAGGDPPMPPIEGASRTPGSSISAGSLSAADQATINSLMQDAKAKGVASVVPGFFSIILSGISASGTSGALFDQTA